MSGAGEAISFPTQFFVKLRSLFPEIAGRENSMWHCYRNGLLHQAAFSQAKRRQGIVVVLNAALSGHDKRPIYYDISGDCFYMNPEEFFDRVKNTILGDFTTYLGSLSPPIRCRVLPPRAQSSRALFPLLQDSFLAPADLISRDRQFVFARHLDDHEGSFRSPPRGSYPLRYGLRPPESFSSCANPLSRTAN